MFEPDALNPWLDDPRLRAAVATAGTGRIRQCHFKKVPVQNGRPLTTDFNCRPANRWRWTAW